jgi:flavin-binding protein dodecin
MSEHVYRVTELVGTSQESIEDAIRTGISRANQTVRNIDWFEVTEIRGYVREGELNHYQVGMKLGFKLEDA